MSIKSLLFPYALKLVVSYIVTEVKADELIEFALNRFNSAEGNIITKRAAVYRMVKEVTNNELTHTAVDLVTAALVTIIQKETMFE